MEFQIFILYIEKICSVYTKYSVTIWASNISTLYKNVNIFLRLQIMYKKYKKWIPKKVIVSFTMNNVNAFLGTQCDMNQTYLLNCPKCFTVRISNISATFFHLPIDTIFSKSFYPHKLLNATSLLYIPKHFYYTIVLFLSVLLMLDMIKP